MGVRVREGGFTLVELTVGMAIFGVLAAFGTSGWLSYQRSVEHRGSAQEIASTLRNAQQAAVAEAVTYCVKFIADGRSYEVRKFSCGPSGVATGGEKKTQSLRVTHEAAQFLQSDSTLAPEVVFLPRGSATKGDLKIRRTDSDKTYTISVEGLTGRVSLIG